MSKIITSTDVLETMTISCGNCIFNKTGMDANCVYEYRCSKGVRQDYHGYPLHGDEIQVCGLWKPKAKEIEIAINRAKFKKPVGD